MSSVSVTELKANLSRYLRQVRRGGEVQILERGRPIARLSGLNSMAHPDEVGEQRREEHIRSGTLIPGSRDTKSILELVPLKTKKNVVWSDELDKEREDRF